MIKVLVVLASVMVVVESADRSYTVTNSLCRSGRTYTIDKDDNLDFIYSGEDISFPCQIKLSANDVFDDVCVSAYEIDTTCKIKLEYHNGLVTSFPDQTVDCHSSTEVHCTTHTTLYVVFDRENKVFSQSYNGVGIKFKAYVKEDGVSEAVGRAAAAVGVVIGVIIGIVVLIGVVSLVVICICCNRRRRSAAGVVYNQTPMQNTTVMQAQYPQGGTGYPAQPVAQPQYYPPPGNQPTGYGQPMGQPPMGPPPMGQPPMAGYQPAPTGYGAGYQSHGEQEKASAPPMGSDFGMMSAPPPPYPGN